MSQGRYKGKDRVSSGEREREDTCGREGPKWPAIYRYLSEGVTDYFRLGTSAS